MQPVCLSSISVFLPLQQGVLPHDLYKESNKGSKERQVPTLGVRFREVSVL